MNAIVLRQNNNSSICDLTTKVAKLKIGHKTTDFRSTSIAPDISELLATHDIFLRPNRTTGKYPSVDDYLSTHFHLMREDFIGPLRNGLRMLKNEDSAVFGKLCISPSKDIFLYPKAHFEKTTCCREGTSYLVSFDLSQMQEIDWENNKRLIYGSFVCFLSEECEIKQTGIVVDGNKIDKGRVSVQLLNAVPNEKIIGQTYLMVEPRSYYNAYLHVLKRLQSFTKHDFPLPSAFIGCLPTFEEPLYLKQNPGISFDLSCVSQDRVLNLPSWMLHGCLSRYKITLDQEQLQAFKHALTRRLALIQGPPGTGKTYIGLKICEVLVRSLVERIEGFGPILVICYTNHALDQFLEGIVQIFYEDVVRVGSQCSSPYLKPYLMREYRSLYNRNCQFSYDLKAKHDDLQNKASSLKSDITLLSTSLKTRDKCLIEFRLLKPLIKGSPLLIHNVDLMIWLLPTCMGNKNSDIEMRMKILTDELDSSDVMSNTEESEISDVWNLPTSDRWRLYRLWRHRFIAYGYPHLDRLCQMYDQICNKLRAIKMKLDLEIFQDQKVIAMTTSCASRYGHILDKLRPKIVLVEEAAEVLESHIICSLTRSCEHLILIGDHQQLRPNPAMFELKRKYALDVSLFERLIKNGFPFDTLQEQRRMRSEISDLVRNIYPHLRDHPIVHKRGDILGLTTNTFFIDHSEQEICSKFSKSYSNSFEATYAVQLVEHLILQGYEATKITIITPYSSQVSLLEEMNELANLRITTIDSYQGEENDIVILSLVRSNEQDNIGFSGDVNRICVALSRARKGMFVLGNFSLFAKKSPLWSSLIHQMKKKKRFGLNLSIKCQLHPCDLATEIASPDDFKLFAPHGGCQRKCTIMLICGHKCPFFCHPFDPEHTTIKCKKPCARYCSRQLHRCPGLCGDMCDPCVVEVTTTIPSTNLTVTLPCFDIPYDWDRHLIRQFKQERRVSKCKRM